MGKQLIDNIFVIASMKLSVALFAAAAAWDQPAWKDVQAALNDEGGRADFDWGHPIDDSSKKWYHCPTINETAIANLDSIKCKNPLAHLNAFQDSFLLDTDVRSASTQKPSELTDGRKRSEPAVAVTSLSHKLILLTLPPHAL